jgi:hypothetical protein
MLHAAFRLGITAERQQQNTQYLLNTVVTFLSPLLTPSFTRMTAKQQIPDAADRQQQIPTAPTRACDASLNSLPHLIFDQDDCHEHALNVRIHPAQCVSKGPQPAALTQPATQLNLHDEQSTAQSTVHHWGSNMMLNAEPPRRYCQVTAASC